MPAAFRKSAAVAAALGVLLLSPGVASAEGDDHSGAEPAANSSRPLPDSTVSTALTLVTVGFNGPLEPAGGHGLAVTDAKGERVDDGRVMLMDAQTLGVRLKPLARTGKYTVVFTGLIDGDKPTGTFTFTYAGPTAMPTPKASTSPPTQLLAMGGGVLVLAGVGAIALRRQRSAAV